MTFRVYGPCGDGSILDHDTFEDERALAREATGASEAGRRHPFYIDQNGYRVGAIFLDEEGAIESVVLRSDFEIVPTDPDC